MTGRAVCSAAPRWRDSHQVGSRSYVVTAPDGRIFEFCSAACLLSYAVWGLPADVDARRSTTPEAA